MVRNLGNKTPKIAPTAFISEAAYIVGEVEIGENSSIWPGAVVRGDVASIKIGNNTQIEDNCVVHTGKPMIIGDSVHVGHNAVIHCSKIGNTVLIGNNATILDGAEIGDFCLIAANSLVMERTKIPNDSFVAGMPAEVKGKITPEQLARIEGGVKFYIGLSREYKQQGLE
jgi:carbonic anhydrase/acetyltransferase-like protein (isoleucine patch superfamily)